MVELHPKPGSIGSTVIGGIIFGMGFAVLGYCPGTVAGAVGHGALDALFGGVTGFLVGAGIFAAAYPVLDEKILSKGVFRSMTLPDALKVNPWYVIIPLCILIAAVLAAGKPMVISDIPPMNEIVYSSSKMTTGKVGMIVPPADTRAFSQAVIDIMKDVTLRREMGMNGQRLIKKRYDIKNVARQYESLYEELFT